MQNCCDRCHQLTFLLLVASVLSPGFACGQLNPPQASEGNQTPSNVDLPDENDGTPTSLNQAPEGFVELFDGVSIEPWIRRGGTAEYRVERGTIVGRTVDGSPNTFLCTPQNYTDFELLFEVKVDDALNSGVQIRSISDPEYRGGRVNGMQVEICVEEGKAGYIYSEARNGWISGNKGAVAAFRAGQWNRYRVIARGDRIQTWINDTAVEDLRVTTDEHPSGFIGLQVHSIESGQGPYEVRWRNLYIREIADTIEGDSGEGEANGDEGASDD